MTGKQLVRTRRADGVTAIPTDALDYQVLFHRHPGDEYPWIESMSYGWGIGHPDHPFEETIESLTEGEYEIWVGTAIEQAMHADQHAATALLEDLFVADIVSDPAQLLQIVGAIDRGYDPDSSDHWTGRRCTPSSTRTASTGTPGFGTDWSPSSSAVVSSDSYPTTGSSRISFCDQRKLCFATGASRTNIAEIASDDDVEDIRFAFDAVSRCDRVDRWPTVPRYWDWEDTLDISFQWKPEIVVRIRDLVAETERVQELPDDWSFQGLAV